MGFLPLSKLVKLAKNPTKLRAEIAKLREAAEQKEQRRANGQLTDEEFEALSPTEQAEYLERLAQEEEARQREAERAARTAELREAIDSLDAEQDDDRERGVHVLVNIARIVQTMRDRHERRHKLECELARLNDHPLPHHRKFEIADLGEAYEIMIDGLSEDERDSHRELLRFIDPEGVQQRATARNWRHSKAYSAYWRAVESVDRLSDQIDAVRRGKFQAVRDPGSMRTRHCFVVPGQGEMREIQTEDDLRKKIEVWEAALQEAIDERDRNAWAVPEEMRKRHAAQRADRARKAAQDKSVSLRWGE